jgi:hypothetical protein
MELLTAPRQHTEKIAKGCPMLDNLYIYILFVRFGLIFVLSPGSRDPSGPFPLAPGPSMIPWSSSGPEINNSNYLRRGQDETRYRKRLNGMSPAETSWGELGESVGHQEFT